MGPELWPPGQPRTDRYQLDPHVRVSPARSCSQSLGRSLLGLASQDASVRPPSAVKTDLRRCLSGQFKWYYGTSPLGTIRRPSVQVAPSLAPAVLKSCALSSVLFPPQDQRSPSRGMIGCILLLTTGSLVLCLARSWGSSLEHRRDEAEAVESLARDELAVDGARSRPFFDPAFGRWARGAKHPHTTGRVA